MAAPLSPDAVALLQRAYARVQAGDGAGGAALLGQLPLAARGHPDALMVGAFAQKAQGALPKARALFEAATRAAPGQASIWNSYANLLDALGEHDLAITAYTRALAIDPRAAATWTNLAIAAIAIKRWDEADAALDKALALLPNDVRALGARGLVAAGQGRLDAAVAAYTAALKLAPGAATLRHNLAAALRSQGRPEAAMAALGTPTLADSAALHGHLLADLGRFDAAIDRYRGILRHTPHHAVTLEALAELLPQLDRAGEALDGYRAALSEAPPPALWRSAIAAAKGVGNAEAMLEWARAAEAAHGRHPDWALAQAGALSQLGDPRDALAAVEAATRDFPQSAGAANFMAWLLLKAGDPARAEGHALRATQLAPLDQSPWALLSLIWRLTGDPREAWLADHDRLVIAATIETPQGWPDLAAFLGDLAATLKARHQTIRAPADQSLRGGTQTRGNLFETADPVLVALRGALMATVAAGLARLTPDAGHPFLGRLTGGVAMAGSWSVRLRSQGFHISHIHHQGWLSSAFYVSLPPEIGASGDAGKLLFGVPDAALGLDLGPRHIVTPQPGRLVIFPSYIWHGTAPFESAAARLTVAFDALPLEN
jgi:tetratricopeptide (TPR) repeat protein